MFAVDFVLKDPRQLEDEKKEKPLPHREEMAVVPKPWNRSYLTALEATAQCLHNTNPCMMQVLNLWHVSFGLVAVLCVCVCVCVCACACAGV